MAKNKTAGRPTMSRRMSEGLSRASELLDQKKPAEALQILEELERVDPNEVEVVVSLINAYYDLQDSRGYEHAVRRLVRMEPRNRDAALMLLAAYFSNNRPAMALRAIEDFLRRWPNDERAPELHQHVEVLKQAMAEHGRDEKIPEDAISEVLLLHDEIRYGMDHAMYEQARIAGEKLLRRDPRFMPGLNNLSTVYAVLGMFERGLAQEQHALEIDPQNFHAHANLARLFMMAGRMDEARAAAEGLAGYPVHPDDRWAKVVETYSLLADDEAVLAAYEQARAEGALETPAADAYFYHIVGASARRLGKLKLARDCWKKALKAAPAFDRAQENLADMDLPLADQNGPWAFPFEELWLGRTVEEFATVMQREARAKSKEIRQAAVRDFLTAHPQVTALAPYMLERGDARAREFVFLVAASSGDAGLLELAKDFVLGKKGAYKLRTKGAQILSSEGWLPNGLVKLWAGDEQHEVLLMNTVISPELNMGSLTKTTQGLLTQAYEAMTREQTDKARELLEKAIVLQPDEPIVQYNLATTLEQLGETEKAHQMIVEIHERFPDYFFGTIGVARQALKAGELNQARDLLNGLLLREKMHTSEFTALCVSQLDVWLAENKLEAAASWLNMLEQVAPTHPAVAYYRQRLGMPVKG